MLWKTKLFSKEHICQDNLVPDKIVLKRPNALWLPATSPTVFMLNKSCNVFILIWIQTRLLQNCSLYQHSCVWRVAMMADQCSFEDNSVSGVQHYTSLYSVQTVRSISQLPHGPYSVLFVHGNESWQWRVTEMFWACKESGKYWTQGLLLQDVTKASSSLLLHFITFSSRRIIINRKFTKLVVLWLTFCVDMDHFSNVAKSS